MNTMPSQADIVLSELERRPGDWVPMPALAAASRAFAVHSRISELRARGHLIEHRNERRGRVVFSFYKLTEPSIA